MSNSSLVNYTKLSPFCSKPRRGKITKITIHHMAGKLTVEECGQIFQERRASANYGVDSAGRVGLYVDEANRAWASSNENNDNCAVTIEVANCGGAPNWPVSDKALAKTIDLCVDICKRNGIKKLSYTGNASGNLTMHKWFTATACPGPYLESKFPYIAQEVNKRLSAAASQPGNDGATWYKVQAGAFRKKAGAESRADALKGAGFKVIVVQSDGMYRVQAGAFKNRSGAVSRIKELNAAGFEAALVQEGPGSSAPAAKPTIKKGSKVRVKNGAKTYTGGGVASFVYKKTYIVDELSGDRAVLDTKGICTPFNVKDLILV